MAKITKSSLAQLAQEMYVLIGQEQKECIGGANSTYSQFGNSLKEARLKDFASVQNPLSTQIGETESPYASTMLFEAEDTQRQHDIFATAFIEELDSAVGTSGGIGVTDIDASVDGSGGIGSGLTGSGGIEPGAVDNDPLKVKYSKPSDAKYISDKTMDALNSACGNAKEKEITITSTARTPAQQAAAMYDNICRTGVNTQYGIYAPAGDKVIGVYNPNLSREENIRNMTAKINEVGPSSVSKHCADPSKVNVFDIALSSIKNVAELKAQFEKQGARVLIENRCMHVEIPQ